MEMIKLHVRHDVNYPSDDRIDSEVFMNPHHIVHCYKSSKGGAHIRTSLGICQFVVTESPEEVVKLIREST